MKRMIVSVEIETWSTNYITLVSLSAIPNNLKSTFTWEKWYVSYGKNVEKVGTNSFASKTES